MDLRKIKTRLVGKTEVFQMLALGEATKLPVLLLGEPGVGKTQALLDYAASKYNYNREAVRKNTFVIELDEGTKTSEIKGRVNMKSLLEDKEYKVDAPIADAEFVLINEVDKGTSGVRNTLLSVMREKAIFYGNEVKKCAWEIFAGSCNIIPNDELENPFWDRFVLTQKVVRIGSDTMQEIWENKHGISEIELKVPSIQEINNTSMEKKHMKKFLNVVYTSASDRTIFHVPFITKAVKIVYSLNDVEAILKTCELIAPGKLGEISAKLETKRENNVRSLVNALDDILKGNNEAYSQLYIGQVADAIVEMGSVGNYYTKAKELAYEVVTTIEKCIHDYDQRNALYGELDGRLLKSAEDYTEVRDKMAAVEGVQLEGVS